MKTSIIIVLALIALVAAVPMSGLSAAKNIGKSPLTEEQYKYIFEAWKEQHNKKYDENGLEEHRFAAFKANVDYVRNFKGSFQVGLNHLSDLTVEEYREQFLGTRPRLAKADSIHINSGKINADSVDWRKKGVVNKIKDQGQCGSCWAFSTIQAIESAIAISSGTLNSLSEQQLVDCSTENNGCNGGYMPYAFQYVIDNGGVTSEKDYPYKAYQQSCKCPCKDVGVISSYVNVTSGDEDALKDAVANEGPCSIGIDASHQSFQMYSSGIYYEPSCSSSQLDHGVGVVGYGENSEGKYWIVRNSWNTVWGMDGYIWMARDRHNNCGVATLATYAIV